MTNENVALVTPHLTGVEANPHDLLCQSVAASKSLPSCHCVKNSLTPSVPNGLQCTEMAVYDGRLPAGTASQIRLPGAVIEIATTVFPVRYHDS